MNSISTMLLAAMLPLAVAVSAQAENVSTNADTDCLLFHNGDVLYGKLLEIQPGHVVRWRHEDAAETMELRPESVAQIDFSPRPSAAGHTHDTCKLWLADGDALSGNLVSCDREALTLETWFAGKLKMPRRALQTLEFTPETPILFDGLTGLEGWTEGNAVKAYATESGQWSYRNGAFYSDKAASIARDLKLPERAQVQFDLTWRGPLNLAIALYTDSLQPILLSDKENGPDFGAFYSLRFYNTVFVSLTPIHKKGPMPSLGDPMIIQALSQKDHVHVDLRMSKASHRVALFLDGALIKDWIDPNGFSGEGSGVRFVNNQGGAIKMSNFRVTKWNGVLDEGAGGGADPLHDVLLLDSGAKISGAVTAIAAGQISMLTTAGTTNVPVAAANTIEFAHFQGQAPLATKVDTHGTFLQGGSVTFELQAWRADGVEALSPDFGKATFDPAVFGRLQFPALDSKRALEPQK